MKQLGCVSIELEVPHLRSHARIAAMALTALSALSAACQSEPASTEPSEFPVQFLVANELIAPVAIAIDGTPYVGLQGGGGAGLTVSSNSQWLTWSSAKPMDRFGQQIPDDIGEVKISVSGINGRLEITNVIGDQTYITARIFNTTNAEVSIGVFDGSAVSCAAWLPAKSGAVMGSTQIGYYKLLPATEVRAYRDPTSCSGPYVPWQSSELKGLFPKSGLLFLSLDSAP